MIVRIAYVQGTISKTTKKITITKPAAVYLVWLTQGVIPSGVGLPTSASTNAKIKSTYIESAPLFKYLLI
jgi:bifunctional pyridoxal-dependent enzyme with beta-cystathionase and maltose regulon repressor activities